MIQLFFLLSLSFAIGIALSLQTAINAQLRTYLHSPLQAALFSFCVGSIVLAILVWLQPAPRPHMNTLMQLPWYLWLGGLLGVYAMSMSIYTAPKMGLLIFSGIVIFGQLAFSLLSDHFGWLGSESYPISWQRLLGAAFILTGVLLTLQK